MLMRLILDLMQERETNMKNILLTFVAFLMVVIAGCDGNKVENIDTLNDDGKAVMELDYRDFDIAASEMIQSLISSGTLTKPGGGRYVMTTSRIVNDTMQRIDTDQLSVKIEEELMNSGKVVMTSAVGKSGTDDMVYEARELRESEEFNQGTVAGEGQLVAPELSLSGKILQRNIKYDSKKQQVEYYFQLRITDITTGLRFWQKESLIGKRGSKKSVAW